MSLRYIKTALKTADLSIAAIPPKVADRFYATPEWRALRKATLERDGYRCALCGGPATIADHITGRRNGGKDELGNLRSLCRDCDNRVKENPTGTRRGQS